MTPEQGSPTFVRPDLVLDPDGNVIARLDGSTDAWPVPSDPQWRVYQKNVKEYLAETPDVTQGDGSIITHRLLSRPLSKQLKLPRIAATIITALGLFSGGVKMADSQADAKPSLTPTPQGISRHLPDNFPSAQKEYQRTVGTETGAKPEQEQGKDFSTVDSAMSGNTLVALVTPEGDSSTYVATLNLDQIDLSSGTWLIDTKYKVPFAVQQSGSIAISPTDPNHILISGYTISDFVNQHGALAYSADGQNYISMPGKQGTMGVGRFTPDGSRAFIPQANIVNPGALSWAEFSVAEQKIVKELNSGGFNISDLTPLVLVSAGGLSSEIYQTYGLFDGPGYAKVQINGDTVTAEIKNQQEGWARNKLLFFQDGKNNIVGLLNTDELAPGSLGMRLGILYLNVNDVQKYAVRPDQALHPSVTSGDLLITAAAADVINRKIYMGIYIWLWTPYGHSDEVKFGVESADLDNPDDVTKHEYTEVGTRIIGDGIGTSITDMYLLSENGRQYMVVAGSGVGIRIADITNGLKQLKPADWRSIKLKSQPKLSKFFLPLATKP